jgi:hypothetical protein
MHRPTHAFIFSATIGMIVLLVALSQAVSPVSGKNLNLQPAVLPSQTAPQPGTAEVLFLTPTPAAGPTRSPVQAQAQNPAPVIVQPTFITPTLPAYINNLQQFTDAVANGEAGVLRGVFVAGVMALPVIQQPQGNFNWISEAYDNVTQFQAATEHGVVGLLAHNTRAGRAFSQLQPGKLFYLVYGDGTTRAYKLAELHAFQALQPLSPSTDYLDLTNGQKLTTPEVFSLYFTGSYPLVLLTCIEKNGDSSWGRLFLMASPAGNGN